MTDKPIRCTHCGGTLINANHRSASQPDYQHAESAAYDHRADPGPAHR